MNKSQVFLSSLPGWGLFLIFTSTGVGMILIVYGLLLERQSSLLRAAANGQPGSASFLSGTGRGPTPTIDPNLLGAVVTLETNQKNCTYFSPYWQEHPEVWLTENILIGQLSYTKKEAIAVLGDESQDLKQRLLKQFLTAALNVLNGADPTSAQPAFDQASQWLGSNLRKLALNEGEIAASTGMLETLEQFNHGLLGPGACPGQPNLPLPGPSVTPTPTPAPSLRGSISLALPSPTPPVVRRRSIQSSAGSQSLPSTGGITSGDINGDPPQPTIIPTNPPKPPSGHSANPPPAVGPPGPAAGQPDPPGNERNGGNGKDKKDKHAKDDKKDKHDKDNKGGNHDPGDKGDKHDKDNQDDKHAKDDKKDKHDKDNKGGKHDKDKKGDKKH